MIHILGYASKHWKHLSAYAWFKQEKTIDRLKHGSLHHSGQNRARGVNRNKRNRYKSMILATIKQEQLILAQGEDSKKGQLIYLTRKVRFQVILYKMIRFLLGKLKKHTKLAKIVKISEIFNRLVFQLNFNRFCHPMTVFLQTCLSVYS